MSQYSALRIAQQAMPERGSLGTSFYEFKMFSRLSRGLILASAEVFFSTRGSFSKFIPSAVCRRSWQKLLQHTMLSLPWTIFAEQNRADFR
jgi:hypothetical protein